MPGGTASDERFQRAIRPACDAASVECRSSVDLASQGQLLQEVYAQLQTVDAVVADVSGNNPNVLFELGYAHALQRPTLILAENFHNLPFDIKSFQVILYGDDLQRLRSELTQALFGLLHPRGEGPLTQVESPPLSQRTQTIVVGDIVSFCSLEARLGELDVDEGLQEYLGRLRNLVAQHGGLNFSSTGDGFIVIFERSDDALAFALEVRSAVGATQLGSLRIRLAIHRSPVAIRRTRHGTDLVGEGLNLAVRLATAARPDQLLLSQAAVADLSPGRLRPPVSKTTVQVKHAGTVEVTAVGLVP
jgi:class 3 adenylate cyclase